MSLNFKHCNMAQIHEHFAGDEEMIAELVEVFDSTYGDVLEELKSSVAQSDFTSMERAAHTLKGMVANFFAAQIKDNCFELETMGKNKDISNANEKVSIIESQITELIEELKAI